jgi:hemerythrin
MNKTEYIKILRELSNYFKSECINTDDFFEDINYEKQNCSIKVIIESIISIICICNDKNYISILLCLLIVINFIKYHVCDSYEKSVTNDYSIIDF